MNHLKRRELMFEKLKSSLANKFLKGYYHKPFIDTKTCGLSDKGHRPEFLQEIRSLTEPTVFHCVQDETDHPIHST